VQVGAPKTRNAAVSAAIPAGAFQGRLWPRSVCSPESGGGKTPYCFPPLVAVETRTSCVTRFECDLLRDECAHGVAEDRRACDMFSVEECHDVVGVVDRAEAVVGVRSASRRGRLGRLALAA
jgi:hypothetical protein